MIKIDDVEKIVIDFIRSNFFLSEKFNNINPKISLMDSGIIDSTGILELIEFLEEKFNITIENSEIIPENLDSLHNISIFVMKKKISKDM